MGATNYPVILSATYDAVNNLSNYAGTLDAAANTPYQIEVFKLATANPSGYGEGQTLLGSVMVTTDSNGHADFLLSVSGALPKHPVLSATATNLTTLSTSEYARNYRDLARANGQGGVDGDGR